MGPNSVLDKRGFHIETHGALVGAVRSRDRYRGQIVCWDSLSLLAGRRPGVFYYRRSAAGWSVEKTDRRSRRSNRAVLPDPAGDLWNTSVVGAELRLQYQGNQYRDSLRASQTLG